MKAGAMRDIEHRRTIESSLVVEHFYQPLRTPIVGNKRVRVKEKKNAKNERKKNAKNKRKRKLKGKWEGKGNVKDRRGEG